MGHTFHSGWFVVLDGLAFAFVFTFIGHAFFQSIVEYLRVSCEDSSWIGNGCPARSGTCR
jgi:hypothetical protein